MGTVSPLADELPGMRDIHRTSLMTVIANSGFRMMGAMTHPTEKSEIV